MKKKYEVHVSVEHWMYVYAESKEEAERLAEDEVFMDSDPVDDTDAIFDDDIERCGSILCEEVEEE